MTACTQHQLLMTLTMTCVMTGACGRQDFSELARHDANSESWRLTEEAGQEEISLEGSPVSGDWSGPGHYGGCIQEGSWQSYREDGTFTQVNFAQDTCMPDEKRALVQCEGAWRLMARHGERGRAGAMLYACRAKDEDTHPSLPQERYVETTFLILERDEGWTELSHQAWLWDDQSGEMHRTFRHETTYPASPGTTTSERVYLSSETTLSLFEATANPSTDAPLRSVDELDPGLLEGSGAVPYLLKIEITASGDFTTFDVSESGTERFVVPVVLEREGEWLSMTAQIEGASEFLAWEEYLQQRGINQRYVALGAVFSVSFSRTLYLGLEEPSAWSVPGAWVKTDALCELYGELTQTACTPDD